MDKRDHSSGQGGAIAGKAIPGEARRAEAVPGPPVIELELPYPPSVNHYWRRVGSRTLISRQGRKFRQDVEMVVRRGVGLRGEMPLQGPLAVEVVLHPPDRRRRDLDNTLKALLDALEHAGVYRDDSLISELRVERGRVAPGGTAVVLIWKQKDVRARPLR